MKLFTKEIDKKLFAQYSKGSDLSKQMVVAKIFNPYGRGRWYLINSDEDDPDYLWAIVDLFEVEVGSVSRKELESIKIKPFNFGLERDLSFTPRNAEEVLKGVMAGKTYAEGGGIYASDDAYKVNVILDGEIEETFTFRARNKAEAREMFEDLFENQIQKKYDGQNFVYEVIEAKRDGGKIGFEALSKKVAARYKGKSVKPKFQAEYGKTYSSEEASEVGDKVAAKVYRQQQAKMVKGGKLSNGKDNFEKGDEGMYQGNEVRVIELVTSLGKYYFDVLDENGNVLTQDLASKEKFERNFRHFPKMAKGRALEGKKRFYETYNVGRSKYVVSFHDGLKKHNDGSDFFGARIFKNKKDLEAFKKELLSNGYLEQSMAKGGEIKSPYIVTFGFQEDGEYAIKKSKPIFAENENAAAIMLKDQFEAYEGLSLDIINVKKMADGGFVAIFNGKKINIEADSLYAAKLKAIQELKVPKSKEGLLSVVSNKSMANQDFRFMADGGRLEAQSLEMAQNISVQIAHHAMELKEALEGKTYIEPWVTSMLQRAADNLSDATHYLEGKDDKMADGGMMAKGRRVMPFLKFEYATEARKKLDKGQLPVFDGGIGFDYIEKEKKLYYLPSVTGDFQEVGEFKSKKESIHWLSEQLKMEGFADGGMMAKGGKIREWDDVYIISKNKLGMVELIFNDVYYVTTPFGETFEATIDDLKKIMSFDKGGEVMVGEIASIAKENEATGDEVVKKISKGADVEMEHTEDRKVAMRIAVDHLKEDFNYYEKLRKAGL